MSVHDRLDRARRVLDTIPAPEQLSVPDRIAFANATAALVAAQLAVLRACREGWLAAH